MRRFFSHQFRHLILHLHRHKGGGVGVIAGLSLPVVLGAAGLAFDINRGLEQQAANQRAADMAALGAAMAFKESASEAVLEPTAKDIVRANGIAGATVEATVREDFPSAGDQSVRVTVTTQAPYTLAKVVGMGDRFAVQTQSFASLTTQAPYAPPCFLALSSANDAITVTGGASIDAPDCSIAAIGGVQNKGQLIRGHDIISGSGDISVNYGTLSAETLRFAGSFSAPSWNGNVPPADKRKNQPTELVDPWADNAELSDARSELGHHTSIPGLSNPDTSVCTGARDYALDWNPNGSNPAKNYWTGSGYNLPAATYCIKKLTTGGGLSIKFASGSRIYVQQGVAISGGTSVDFGDSDIFVNGGFDSGSSGVTIGDGTLWIGSGGQVKWQGTNHKGNGTVIINQTIKLGGGQKLLVGDGSHFFGGFDLGGGGSAKMGDGDFTAVAGIFIAGGSELAVGDGDYLIGPGSGNSAIKLSGSAIYLMGDGTFSANGDIDTAGGSRIAFGRTRNHYINGNLKIAGSAVFGAGRYTIAGDFANGTGGTTWPYTSPLNGITYGSAFSGYDMGGSDVTFILGGTLNLAGGARTKLVAPSGSVAGGQIADLLVDSLTTADTNWTGGSANNFAGTVHVPNSNVKMSGGNTTLGNGQCFTLIAGKIAANGGAATGSACQSMAGDTDGKSSSIRLVR
ncbi:conserved hypothetical protein [Novosphingobium sp. PP1Y]|nr:conserved hypothetical protein [Novosphingobium sp. PP1Y]